MTTQTPDTEVQQLRRELAEMRERLEEGAGQPDDSIAVARREIEAQFFNATPSIMDKPCAHVDQDGNVCGKSWKLDNDTIRAIHNTPALGTHSYRPVPVLSNPTSAGNAYHLSKSDREQYGVEEPEPKTAQDTYVSEKQAAAMLSVNVKALRAMLKAGTVAADKIGEVTLVRRQSVERILAMAEAARGADGDDDE